MERNDTDLEEKSGVEVVGFIIFLIIMITAFFGYLLPWGQMSF